LLELEALVTAAAARARDDIAVWEGAAKERADHAAEVAELHRTVERLRGEARRRAEEGDAAAARLEAAVQGLRAQVGGVGWIGIM
jgi:hypothetical protein